MALFNSTPILTLPVPDINLLFPTGDANEIVMEKANKKAVEIHYQLDVPVREDIYEYLCDVPD